MGTLLRFGLISPAMHFSLGAILPSPLPARVVARCVLLVMAALASGACSPPDERREVDPAVIAGDDSIALPEVLDPEPTPTTALLLDGEGFRVVTIETGATRGVPFATPAQTLMDILDGLDRGPPIEQGRNLDCRLDYATWADGLTVSVADGRFVGWSLSDGDAGLTTMGGIGVGATRAALESVYAAEIRPSSLGLEFTAGGLSGILDSGEPDGRITHLWAGQVCLAR